MDLNQDNLIHAYYRQQVTARVRLHIVSKGFHGHSKANTRIHSHDSSVLSLVLTQSGLFDTSRPKAPEPNTVLSFSHLAA